jgi:predicted O-methyltransferase YrrM
MLEGAENPWHVGTMDSASYPVPHELIQGELEMLAHMFTMVVQLKPKLVVETGTNVGLMARALGAGCWTNGFGRVVTSDTDQRMVDYAKKICAGFPVEIRCCPSLELSELREADLVFVDSSYESRSQEIHFVKSGAVYVYHDSYAEPWIRDEMAPETYKVHLDTPRGFSIVRKP